MHTVSEATLITYLTREVAHSTTDLQPSYQLHT